MKKGCLRSVRAGTGYSLLHVLLLKQGACHFEKKEQKKRTILIRGYKIKGMLMSYRVVLRIVLRLKSVPSVPIVPINCAIRATSDTLSPVTIWIDSIPL